MTARRTDRVAGGALLALAVLAALQAVRFRVAFLGDPIGPRAIPWLAAALMAAGALWLLARPDPDRPWPPRAVLARVLAVTAAFLAYPALLRPLGFPLATTLLVFALAMVFEGRPVRSLLASAALAAGLHLLFATALGVPLPAGLLFGGAR